MKKLFMFLMAAFLLVGIAACNGDDTTVVTEDTEETTTTTEQQETTTTTEEETTTTTADPYPDEPTYPSGLYNYKFQSTEVRHTFMAAAERFLMETMYGGVPLYANGGYILFSERLQLPIDEFIPVMGFGTGYATMTADDSTVLMADGEPGEVGEYTYRTTINNGPQTWNPWFYEISTDATIMGIHKDAAYTYQFNDAKTGYEVVPSMAAADPVAVDSEITDTGQEISTIWRIEIRDDLEWFYHPDTDTTNLPAGHEVIDANDFVDTYKLALTNGWFRATSGGGDFLNSNTGVVGAEDFVNDPSEANWANVGIKLIDDHTIEFEYINSQSEWNVKYQMASFVMSPINVDLYNEIGDPDIDANGTFGTSNTTIAYHGAYYVDYYEADKTLVYKENPNYHTPDEYFYTGYEMQVIEDSAVRFTEFEAGKLEAVPLPTENYDDYKNHPGLKQTPGDVVWKININGLGTEQKQQERFPGSTWEPLPLLANQNFKMAMFFAVDRKFLAETVLKTAQTEMFIYSGAYIVDPQGGVPYRNTEEGIAVGEGFAPGSFGYNKDAAVAYFELAVEELYDNGQVDYGDTIEIEFNIFSGSEGQILLGRYIETTFEETFIHEELRVSVDLIVQPFDGNTLYDLMMSGSFDLSFGTIGGNTLDAAAFLDVFADDNRSGFTLNFGIDTSTAEIPVKYETYDYDDQGEIIETYYHYEMWSFNAIYSILTGQSFIQDGEEAEVPRPIITEITPTTYTFEIAEFNNPAYTNIQYTIQEWDLVNSTYVDVDGMVKVDALTAEITVEGLKPYPYDYQIVVYYDLASGENEEPFVQSTWEYSAEVVESVETTDTTATVTLNTDEATFDREFVVDSVTVYLAADDSEVTTATVTYNGSIVTISGLDPETAYYITFDTDDGFTDQYVIYYGLYADIETTATPTT